MNKDCVGCGRTFHTEGDEAGEDGLCVYCTTVQVYSVYINNEPVDKVNKYRHNLACSQWKVAEVNR